MYTFKETVHNANVPVYSHTFVQNMESIDPLRIIAKELRSVFHQLEFY